MMQHIKRGTLQVKSILRFIDVLELFLSFKNDAKFIQIDQGIQISQLEKEEW